MHDIGEKPGRGRYCCTNCNWSVYLDNADDRLHLAGAAARGSTRSTTAADKTWSVAGSITDFPLANALASVFGSRPCRAG